jgi:hypothetical protein
MHTFSSGDFVSYLKTAEASFDICLASGVLYHTINPAELIYLISRKNGFGSKKA